MFIVSTVAPLIILIVALIIAGISGNSGRGAVIRTHERSRANGGNRGGSLILMLIVFVIAYVVVGILLTGSVAHILS